MAAMRERSEGVTVRVSGVSGVCGLLLLLLAVITTHIGELGAVSYLRSYIENATAICNIVGGTCVDPAQCHTVKLGPGYGPTHLACNRTLICCYELVDHFNHSTAAYNRTVNQTVYEYFGRRDHHQGNTRHHGNHGNHGNHGIHVEHGRKQGLVHALSYKASNRSALCELINGTCTEPSACALLERYQHVQGYGEKVLKTFACNVSTICCYGTPLSSLTPLHGPPRRRLHGGNYVPDAHAPSVSHHAMYGSKRRSGALSSAHGGGGADRHNLREPIGRVVGTRLWRDYGKVAASRRKVIGAYHRARHAQSLAQSLAQRQRQAGKSGYAYTRDPSLLRSVLKMRLRVMKRELVSRNKAFLVQMQRRMRLAEQRRSHQAELQQLQLEFVDSLAPAGAAVGEYAYTQVTPLHAGVTPSGGLLDRLRRLQLQSQLAALSQYQHPGMSERIGAAGTLGLASVHAPAPTPVSRDTVEKLVALLRPDAAPWDEVARLAQGLQSDDVRTMLGDMGGLGREPAPVRLGALGTRQDSIHRGMGGLSGLSPGMGGLTGLPHGGVAGRASLENMDRTQLQRLAEMYAQKPLSDQRASYHDDAPPGDIPPYTFEEYPDGPGPLPGPGDRRGVPPPMQLLGPPTRRGTASDDMTTDPTTTTTASPSKLVNNSNNKATKTSGKAMSNNKRTGFSTRKEEMFHTTSGPGVLRSPLADVPVHTGVPDRPLADTARLDVTELEDLDVVDVEHADFREASLYHVAAPGEGFRQGTLYHVGPLDDVVDNSPVTPDTDTSKSFLRTTHESEDGAHGDTNSIFDRRHNILLNTRDNMDKIDINIGTPPSSITTSMTAPSTTTTTTTSASHSTRTPTQPDDSSTTSSSEFAFSTSNMTISTVSEASNIVAGNNVSSIDKSATDEANITHSVNETLLVVGVAHAASSSDKNVSRAGAAGGRSGLMGRMGPGATVLAGIRPFLRRTVLRRHPGKALGRPMAGRTPGQVLGRAMAERSRRQPVMRPLTKQTGARRSSIVENIRRPGRRVAVSPGGAVRSHIARAFNRIPAFRRSAPAAKSATPGKDTGLGQAKVGDGGYGHQGDDNYYHHDPDYHDYGHHGNQKSHEQKQKKQKKKGTPSFIVSDFQALCEVKGGECVQPDLCATDDLHSPTRFACNMTFICCLPRDKDTAYKVRNGLGQELYGAVRFEEVTDRAALCGLKGGSCLSPAICNSKPHDDHHDYHHAQHDEAEAAADPHAPHEFFCNLTAVCCLPTTYEVAYVHETVQGDHADTDIYEY